jgi:uncharacterized membrane protein
MTGLELLQQLQASPLGTTISESDIIFPWIEALHVLAITCVVGSITVVDLRLLGVASRSDRIARMMREVVPFTVAAFVVAAITGSLLFISAAERYWRNPYFKAKLVLLVCAGINMLVFHFITSRQAEQWDRQQHAPMRARVAGGVSLALWVAVIVCGRWVGFTL